MVAVCQIRNRHLGYIRNYCPSRPVVAAPSPVSQQMSCYYTARSERDN